MGYRWSFLFVIALSMFGNAAQAKDELRTVLSEENVPLHFYKMGPDAFTCSDAIPKGLYGGQAGHLSLSTKDMLERTLRLAGVESFYTDLPEGVTCETLTTQIAKVPDSLTAHRKVTRVVKGGRSELEAQIEVTLPFSISAKPAVLHASQDWIEQNLPSATFAASGPAFPFSDPFAVKLHPPSATRSYGLYCERWASYLKEHLLTIGGTEGASGDFSGDRSNIKMVKALFPTEQACEEVRGDLLNAYAAEDPDNWGVWAKVERKAEIKNRYIVTNMAQMDCQEIEIETVRLNLRGTILRGSKSFVVRTVPSSECIPQ